MSRVGQWFRTHQHVEISLFGDFQKQARRNSVVRCAVRHQGQRSLANAVQKRRIDAVVRENVPELLVRARLNGGAQGRVEQAQFAALARGQEARNLGLGIRIFEFDQSEEDRSRSPIFRALAAFALVDALHFFDMRPNAPPSQQVSGDLEDRWLLANDAVKVLILYRPFFLFVSKRRAYFNWAASLVVV